jgi:phosphomannomutase
MSESLIISVSGLRGIVGESLTASVASDYAGVFGTFLKKTLNKEQEKLSICIGRDTRKSGPALAEAAARGLNQVGIDVIDLGIVTTPGVGIMVKHLGCSGGVIITASHNPVQYNGIKLLMSDSMAPRPDIAERIKHIFLDSRFEFVEPEQFGSVTSSEETDRIHIEKVLSLVEKDKIASKNFNIVLDPVNGAAGRVTKKLLAELGCRVRAINDDPSGEFAHTPEPLAQNLTGLCDVVKSEKADIGFAQDPDGDRLAIVDENGSYIGEEYTLALATKYVLSKTVGTVATNLSTSRLIDDVALCSGGRVIRTPVGEVNVASAMVEHNCIIGGEGNGGVIDLRVVPIRDSLVAICFVLQLMTDTNKTISQLVGEIGRYYMVKHKFTVDKDQLEKILESAKVKFSNAKLNDIDGCRFDFDDGWLHLRPSNTEPVVRLIVEAKDKNSAQKYINVIEQIRSSIKK